MSCVFVCLVLFFCSLSLSFIYVDKKEILCFFSNDAEIAELPPLLEFAILWTEFYPPPPPPPPVNP